MTENEIKRDLIILMHKLKNPVHSALINIEVLKIKSEKMHLDATTTKHLQIAFEDVQRINQILERFQIYLEKPDKERTADKLKKYLDE